MLRKQNLAKQWSKQTNDQETNQSVRSQLLHLQEIVDLPPRTEDFRAQRFRRLLAGFHQQYQQQNQPNLESPPKIFLAYTFRGNMQLAQHIAIYFDAKKILRYIHGCVLDQALICNTICSNNVVKIVLLSTLKIFKTK